jgi:hypothetical protein
MGLNAIDYNVLLRGEDFDRSVSSWRVKHTSGSRSKRCLFLSHTEKVKCQQGNFSPIVLCKLVGTDTQRLPVHEFFRTLTDIAFKLRSKEEKEPSVKGKTYCDAVNADSRTSMQSRGQS